MVCICRLRFSTSDRNVLAGKHEILHQKRCGSLYWVDLQSTTKTRTTVQENQSAKETLGVQQSLSSLKDVLEALSSRQPHIPYRRSKLTQLLQPCLSGSGHAIIIASISPSTKRIRATLDALTFAAGCKAKREHKKAKGKSRREKENRSMDAETAEQKPDDKSKETTPDRCQHVYEPVPERRSQSVRPYNLNKRKCQTSPRDSGLPHKQICLRDTSLCHS